MKYSIVIPTYNHCDDLLKPCIESIFKYTNVCDIELIVSANGCKDNSFEYLGSLKEKFTSLGLGNNFKVVWNSDPIGYSRATNEGIKVATTNFIVLLNNDTILVYDRQRLGWWEWQIAGSDGSYIGANCFAEWKNTNGETKLYFGSPIDGNIYYFDQTINK